MKILLATFALVALLAAPIDVVPTAEAAPCVFSYTNEPGCIVPNPCDPRFCDPFILFWLKDTVEPLLP